MDEPRIQLPSDEIAAFCRRNHIVRLSLFGSVLRSDFTSASDVDVLAEFEPGYRPGLAFFGMGDELESILGRRVDFTTAAWISDRFRHEVEAQARPIYDAAA